MKYSAYVTAICRADGKLALMEHQPDEWGLLKDGSGETLTVITTKEETSESLIIWQMPDRGQSYDEAIQEAIISTIVESWEADLIPHCVE